MKKFKIILGLSIAIGAAIFVYSCTEDSTSNEIFEYDLESFALQDSIPQPFGCAYFSGIPCTNHTETFTIYGVPGYPGCSFTMEVEHCDASSTVVIKRVELLSYSCQMYADSLDYFANTPSALDDVEFENRTNALFLSKLEDYFFGLVNPIVQCNYGSSITVSSVSAQCRSICYYKIKQEKIPQDTVIVIGGGDRVKTGENSDLRGPKPISKSTSCNDDGCCVRNTEMCYDPVSGTVVKTTTYLALENSPNCNGASPIPVYDPAYLELVKCTPCQFSCPRVN